MASKFDTLRQLPYTGQLTLRAELMTAGPGGKTKYFGLKGAFETKDNVSAVLKLYAGRDPIRTTVVNAALAKLLGRSEKVSLGPQAAKLVDCGMIYGSSEEGWRLTQQGWEFIPEGPEHYGVTLADVPLGQTDKQRPKRIAEAAATPTAATTPRNRLYEQLNRLIADHTFAKVVQTLSTLGDNLGYAPNFEFDQES